jgi:hypothetical protein
VSAPNIEMPASPMSRATRALWLIDISPSTTARRLAPITRITIP